MRIFVGVVGVAAVAFIGLVACSSSSSSNGGSGGDSSICNAKSKCPNDPPPQQADITTCNYAINDPSCGAKAKVLFQCNVDNQTCGADGKNVANPACDTQGRDWLACMQHQADAGAD